MAISAVDADVKMTLRRLTKKLADLGVPIVSDATIYDSEFDIENCSSTYPVMEFARAIAACALFVEFKKYGCVALPGVARADARARDLEAVLRDKKTSAVFRKELMPLLGREIRDGLYVYDVDSDMDVTMRACVVAAAMSDAALTPWRGK